MKEQGDTEIGWLSLERKIKAMPRKKWLNVQKKLRRIIQNYEDYEILVSIFVFVSIFHKGFFLGSEPEFVRKGDDGSLRKNKFTW